MGHLSRCISLALQFITHEGNTVVFAIWANPVAQNYLERYNLPYVCLMKETPKQETLQLQKMIVEGGYQVGVFDSYDLNAHPGYLHFFKRIPEFTVVAIEDNVKYPEQADIIINPNLFGGDRLNLYDPNQSLLLFGPQYALLNPTLLPQRKTADDSILITFGGSDPQRMTLPVLQAISELGFPCSVIVGPFFEETAKIKGYCESFAHLHVHEQVTDLGPFLARSKLAICASGSTIHEAAYLGVPTLTYWTVPNQRLTAEKYGELGLGVNMGAWADFDPGRLNTEVKSLLNNPTEYEVMVHRNRKLIDGAGGQRLVKEITRYVLSGSRYNG